MIQHTEAQAPLTAQNRVARCKSEIQDEALRVNLIELIETTIMYKLPDLTREEIQAMLHPHDIRRSRAYQQTFEEGVEKERQRQIEERRQQIPKMAALNISPADIASFLGLDINLVNQELGKKPG
jgi:predicted transposase YdaD